MKRFPFFVVVLAVLAFLTACSSRAYLVMNSATKRKPLEENVEVRFIYAPEVPIIPENTELVAVMMTNSEVNCSLKSGVAALERTAREIGADLVFVKENKTGYATRGLTNQVVECRVLTADFYATK